MNALGIVQEGDLALRRAAAAIARPPGTNDSFFDVRCLIPRPLGIHVKHQDITGKARITIFERGDRAARAHEIDHLHGILCRDHLPPGVPPIPV